MPRCVTDTGVEVPQAQGGIPRAGQSELSILWKAHNSNTQQHKENHEHTLLFSSFLLSLDCSLCVVWQGRASLETYRGDGDILDVVRVSSQTLLGNSVLLLIAGKVPHDDRLI